MGVTQREGETEWMFLLSGFLPTTWSITSWKAISNDLSALFPSSLTPARRRWLEKKQFCSPGFYNWAVFSSNNAPCRLGCRQGGPRADEVQESCFWGKTWEWMRAKEWYLRLWSNGQAFKHMWHPSFVVARHAGSILYLQALSRSFLKRFSRIIGLRKAVFCLSLLALTVSFCPRSCLCFALWCAKKGDVDKK